jgi:hypothetical protein
MMISVSTISIGLKELLLVVAKVLVGSEISLQEILLRRELLTALPANVTVVLSFSLVKSIVPPDGAAEPDSNMLVQEAMADEIWEKAVQVHAVSVPEIFSAVEAETVVVVEAVIFAAVLAIF